MEEDANSTRYWCHMCARLVIPVIEGEIIECNFCQSGFVEETDGIEDPVTNDDHLHQAADSMWTPILMGMMNDQTRNQRVEENDDGEVDLDRQLEEIMRRRRSHSAAILDLLQGIRAGLSQSNRENSDSELMVLINTFNERIRVEDSMDTANSVPSGDYFMGPGFEMLLERLAENDLLNNRYGTPPATKKAVEALEVVEIKESLLQCTVCLDDFEIGMEAKEMPCKHKFHNDCLLPWLELHSSCPVCRYLLPATDDDDDDEPKTDAETSRNDDNDDDGSSLDSSLNNSSA